MDCSDQAFRLQNERQNKANEWIFQGAPQGSRCVRINYSLRFGVDIRNLDCGCEHVPFSRGIARIFAGDNKTVKCYIEASAQCNVSI